MVETRVIIAGGGIAGLAVARTLLESGTRCTIVERNLHLGGHVGNWACMATDRCQRCFCCQVDGLIRDVRSSELVEVLTGWELSEVVPSDGPGKRVILRETGSGAEVPADASAVVVATGFEPYDPAEKLLWGHGRLGGVYTLAEVDGLLRKDMLADFAGDGSGLDVAFFQCVGSRDAGSGANYCSEYCCKAALRMALKLIHEDPRIAVTVFYIDLQVAGKYADELMKEAKAKNVRLRQGVPGEITQDSEDRLELIVEDQGRNVRESFDRVVLSIGQRPREGMSSLARALRVPVNDFGYMEPNATWDGSRTAVPGVYVAGTCTGPKDIERTLEHAGQTVQAILANMQTGRLG